LRGAGRDGAGADRLSVHDYGACSTLTQAAAKPGAMQSQIVTQDV
jgi:hypothetical protein